MGRYKKGLKLVRSDLWEKVGGTDVIVKKLLNADILNTNTAKSSDVWSQLVIGLFKVYLMMTHQETVHGCGRIGE